MIVYTFVGRKQCPVDAGAKQRYTTRCRNSRATQSGANLYVMITCSVTKCMCGILQIVQPFVTAVAHHSTDSCTSNKIT